MEELKVISVERADRPERREPVRRKQEKADRKLMWAWITNAILLGIICIMAVAIYILRAGPM